jgi:hypothetical protein
VTFEAFLVPDILVVWPSLVIGVEEGGCVTFELSWLTARFWIVIGGDE